METYQDAKRIENKEWEALPRRLLQLVAAALLLMAMVPLGGCGIIKPDDDQRMYGPKQTFEPRERASGGA